MLQSFKAAQVIELNPQPQVNLHRMLLQADLVTSIRAQCSGGVFTFNHGGSLPGAIVWFLTVGVLLCFSTTRFYGVLLGALFIYAYPLLALMVFITALGAGYLIHKWRVNHGQLHHFGTAGREPVSTTSLKARISDG